MRVLILGAGGMLGHALCNTLAKGHEVSASFRSTKTSSNILGEKFESIDVTNSDDLHRVFAKANPEVVINAVGVVKQHELANNPLYILPINSILPHRLANLCALSGARLIHISTDCVFSGIKGNYSEIDNPDPEDLYGRSKLIGEVTEGSSLTIRTSIIGHEINSRRGLVEWFLNAPNTVNGYKNAFFSGLTTNELARVISDYILQKPDLCGLYHVGGNKISKFELLNVIKDIYGIDKNILQNESVTIDRSLNSDKFKIATGFNPRRWEEMIYDMRQA